MKRAVDLGLAAFGLLIFSLVGVIIALLIKFDDGGPIFFCQQRVGRWGRHFKIWKFRTMRVDVESNGPAITRMGDERVTQVGTLLRKWKVDELPQLFNILRGEMSFVGPRPEVPQYVALYSEKQRRILKLRPGITDLATLEFRNEEELLASAKDPEHFYREYCLPRKIELNIEYASTASVCTDIRLILRTMAVVWFRSFNEERSA